MSEREDVRYAWESARELLAWCCDRRNAVKMVSCGTPTLARTLAWNLDSFPQGHFNRTSGPAPKVQKTTMDSSTQLKKAFMDGRQKNQWWCHVRKHEGFTLTAVVQQTELDQDPGTEDHEGQTRASVADGCEFHDGSDASSVLRS